MTLDPQLLKKYRGILYLVLGIIMTLIPVRVVYILIGVGLILVSLPNLLAAGGNLQGHNPFIIIVFIKSFILVISAVFLIFFPNFVNLVCIIAGVVLILGTLLERLAYDRHGPLKTTEIIFSVFGLLVLLFGGFSFVESLINIVKIVIGIFLIITGLIMIFTARPTKFDFQKTIDEYEKRYHEEHDHDENDENSDIIDGTYEENNENKDE